MSSTNKTTYYELSQYVGSDKPTYLGDYNSDMLKIDTGLHAAADAADTAVTTANAANSAATSASTTASTALSTAQSASTTASQAQTTAETALTNAGSAQSAAEEAETAARANTIANLAPAYDSTLTYAVGDLITYIDSQGSGKLYKCIVAVETPEAFNINKWDDVTISYLFNYIEGTITNAAVTLNPDYTYCYKIGNLVFFQIRAALPADLSTPLCRLPYKPLRSYTGIAMELWTGANTGRYTITTTQGDLSVDSSLNGKDVLIYGSFISLE